MTCSNPFSRLSGRLWLRAFAVAAAFAGFAAFGCQGPSRSPATVRIFSRDPAVGTYRLFDARLETLDDVPQLRGSAARLHVNGSIAIDPFALDRGAVASAVRIEGTEVPQAGFAKETSGVLVPSDADAQAMATLYWEVEQSRRLFGSLGVSADEMPALDVLYNPRAFLVTDVVQSFRGSSASAGYLGTVDALLVVTAAPAGGDVPFMLNPGIIGHEYGHRINNLLLNASDLSPLPLRRHWSARGRRQSQALDEGLADLFGAALVGDPDFMVPSLGRLAASQPDLLASRQLSTLKALSPREAELLEGLDDDAPFDAHVPGGVVAALLWRVGHEAGDTRGLVAAVLAAERQLGAELADEPSRELTLQRFFQALHRQLPAGTGAALCRLVQSQLAASGSGLPVADFC